MLRGPNVLNVHTARYQGKYGKKRNTDHGVASARSAAAPLIKLARSKQAKVGVVVATAAAATALGAGLASGSSASTGKTRSALAAAPSTEATTTTVTTIPTTTTTVDSVPPGTPIAVPAAGLGVGASDPAVLAVKQRLALLRYDPGDVSSAHFDYPLYDAVVAFQKVHGLPRTGRVTPDVAAALAQADLPAAMLTGAEPTRVEIDLTRQVLFFWQDARLTRILPVSTGFGGHYCGNDGSCGIATTPTGAYQATSKIKGIHVSPLGELWDPVFFNGGIAIHGEPSVPVTPASHGCVRIPMNDSTWMYDSLALGTPVYVRDDSHAPVPFDQGGTEGPRQPGGTPPTLPHPTATTATAAPTTATTPKTPTPTVTTRAVTPTAAPPATKP